MLTISPDSSPIHYISSSPTRGLSQTLRSDALSIGSGGIGSGLFVSQRQDQGRRGAPGRSDLQGGFGSTPSRRNRIFVDANGRTTRESASQSDATFSNIHPGTSDAEGKAGSKIWGTSISVQDVMSAFKNFLYRFTTKYRLWADGATEDETRVLGDAAEKREYVIMLNDMRRLGVTTFNLDCANLKAYPGTLKLWHQLLAYPQEIIPLLDQAVKDVMEELALEEMDLLRSQGQRDAQGRGQSVPSSDGLFPPVDVPNVAGEVAAMSFKVLPFGLDKPVNMRDLDPAGNLRISMLQRV